MALTFDTSELNSSTFKGASFYTLDSSLQSGKRLTNHKFIDSGTRTEENGNDDKVFTIEGYITGSDYQTTKTALIKALDSSGSGTLIDTYYGELEVFVDSYTIKESSKSNGKADISITFVLEENELDETQFVSMSRNTNLDTNIYNEFRDIYNPNLGLDVLNDVAETIKTVYNATNNAIKFIESTGDTKQLLQSTIDLAISNTDASYISNVENIISDISNINLAMNNFYAENTLDESEMKSSSNLIYSTINEITEIDETNLNEVEKLSLSNKVTFINTQTIVQLQSLNEQLETTDFTTGDSFGSTKSDVLDTFEILDHSLETQDSLDELKTYKSDYIKFITQKYSSLQNLQDENQGSTVDIYTYTLNKYNDIDRVNEVLENNDILDPIFINGNLQVLNK